MQRWRKFSSGGAPLLCERGGNTDEGMRVERRRVGGYVGTGYRGMRVGGEEGGGKGRV